MLAGRVNPGTILRSAVHRSRIRKDIVRFEIWIAFRWLDRKLQEIVACVWQSQKVSIFHSSQNHEGGKESDFFAMGFLRKTLFGSYSGLPDSEHSSVLSKSFGPTLWQILQDLFFAKKLGKSKRRAGKPLGFTSCPR